MSDNTAAATETKTGYVNGSDLLLKIGTKALGHCTSHTITYNTESKDRKVKALASNTTLGVGLWKEKGIVGLSVSISGEGLRTYDETELSASEIKGLWKLGTPVTCYGYERDSQDSPNMVGTFIVTSFEEASPAEDDTTYSISLENTGQVFFDDDITETVLAKFS